MRLTECPVCSSREFKEVLQVKDQLVSNEVFTITECTNCTLRFTNPRPENEELGGYYESEDYISHTNEGNSIINRLYKIARSFTLRSKRKLIQKDSGAKKLLDIGCGTGHFISYCSENNWECYGVEPDAKARNIAEENGNLKIFAELDEIENQQFDRITLWHVLEHLPDLKGSLQTISRLLKDDGKLFVAVPNYTAQEAKKFAEHWAAYDVPRHLYHFNQEAMNLLINKSGMIVEKTHPMWLDSFYISLLSNEHKYGQHKLFNSFITGLLSNIYGNRTGDFSSLIYQISKTR